ncbi:hypothetical protein GOP47_0028319 [Adiantum capillus-veneris]|nr:hypothetical protein GOP47_0028319 [Adiantum capillus-veneris]
MPQIQYSEKYFDDVYEYRHVVLPPDIAKLLPKNQLLSENEWRALGVQQSQSSAATDGSPSTSSSGIVATSKLTCGPCSSCIYGHELNMTRKHLL